MEIGIYEIQLVNFSPLFCCPVSWQVYFSNSFYEFLSWAPLVKLVFDKSTRKSPFYSVMAADSFAMQGAKASAAIILI